ncbi:MAG: alpha/beta fold hydrolase [Rhodanobacteraceae bacterium]
MRSNMDEAQRAILLLRVRRRLKIAAVLIGVLALAVVLIYFAAPQWILRADNAWQAHQAQLDRKTIQVGDTRWAYYEGGHGPPLVLLHGYMGDRETWLDVARYLTPNFRVIVPDLPGWGQSQRSVNADYSYTAQVQRLNQFADALHLGAFALAGHSMGGAIAGVYAASDPQRVAALILIDSGGVPFKENAFTHGLRSGRNPFDVTSRADFEKLERDLFAKPPWIPGRIEDIFVDRTVKDRAFDDRVLREIAAPDQRNALTSALSKITAPTLTIWCRQDRIIDVSAVDAIRVGLTQAPKIDVTEFNGCGHMSIMERPKEIADAITRFVLAP